MMLEDEIRQVIKEAVAAVKRPDLFREPLVSFSSAQDPRYADLRTKHIGEWHKLPSDLLPGARSVISYFAPFTREVVEQPRGMRDGAPLWAEAYQVINEHFNKVNQAVIDLLELRGHRAAAVKSTHTYDPCDLKCFWSHRSAAVIAELGAFGMNRLVITEKGSGGRFCTVITSAELTPNTTPAEVRCLWKKDAGICGLCFKACPVRALKPDSMEKFVCQDELNKNERILAESIGLTSADTCGKCISVCPLAYLE